MRVKKGTRMVKTHDRDYFCKYTTAKVAQLILDTLTVRWSSPALFNDPFDTQLELRFGFEAAEFPEPMAQAIEKLVFAESEPPWVVPDRLGRAVTMLRLIRHKLPPAEFARKSREALESGIRNATETMRLYHEWWPKYVRTMRVCCVAEEHDNLLMWSHYASSIRAW